MKVLYRSRKNRVIAGVCGGIGEYFDVDPTIIRILWILFSIFGGMGIIAYIIAWILIPDIKSKKSLIDEWTKKGYKPTKQELEKRSSEGAIIIGLFLIFVGVAFLMSNFGWFAWSWNYTWPTLIIVLGVIVILSRRPKKK